MIRVRQLSLKRRGAELLSGIDLDVTRGEALALLGTNGCGRTLLLEILATLRRPTGGTVEIGGIDALREQSRARRELCLVEAEPGLHPELTAGEYLEFCLESRGIDEGRRRRLSEGLRLAELAPEQLIGELSPGLCQRLDLAAALALRTPVLLLDQALTKIDPLARPRFVRALEKRRTEGCAILLATHCLVGLDGLCRQVAVLQGGRIVARQALAPGQDPGRILAGVSRDGSEGSE